MKAIRSLLIALFLVSSPAAFADTPEAAESHIQFNIMHADASKGPVDGSFKKFEVVGAKVDLTDLASTYVELEIDIASIDTGIGARDEHLKSPDFFDVPLFPKARVRVDQVENTGKNQYKATATLSLHGIEKALPVTFTVVEKLADGGIVVEAKHTLNRRTFSVGAEPEKTGAVETVEVSLRLVLHNT